MKKPKVEVEVEVIAHDRICLECGAHVPEGAGHTHGEDTPEANEAFWEAAREQFLKREQ